MVNHTSVVKRLRQSKERRLRNRYAYKSVRTSLKQLYKNIKKNKEGTDKESFRVSQRILSSKIDKLAKKNVIHKNKSAHLKSRIAHLIASI